MQITDKNDDGYNQYLMVYSCSYDIGIDENSISIEKIDNFVLFGPNMEKTNDTKDTINSTLKEEIKKKFEGFYGKEQGIKSIKN